MLVLTGGGRGAGPLVARDEIQSGSSKRAGTVFSYGVPVVLNTGDEVAILERVRLDGADPGLELVGAMAAGKEREFVLVSGDPSFPPRDDPIAGLRALRGFPVPPESKSQDDIPGVELVLGLRTAKPGNYVARGVRVDYHVGDESYSRLLPVAFAVCTSSKRKLPRCPPNILSGV